MRFRTSALLISMLAATACNSGSGTGPSLASTGQPGGTTSVGDEIPPPPAPTPPAAPEAARTCEDVAQACRVESSHTSEAWRTACTTAVDSALAHGANLSGDCVMSSNGTPYHVMPVYDQVSGLLGVFTDPGTGQLAHEEDAVIQMLKTLSAKGIQPHADAKVAGSENDFYLPVIAALAQKNFKVAEYLVSSGQSLDQYGPWGSHDLCDLFYSPMMTTEASFLQFVAAHGFNPDLPCLKAPVPGSPFASAPLWLALTRYDDAFFQSQVLPHIKDPGDVNTPVLYYNEAPGSLGAYVGLRAGELGLGWSYGTNLFDTLPLYVTINHMSLAGTQYLFAHGAKLTSDMNYPILTALYNFSGNDEAFKRFDRVVQTLVAHGLSLANYSLETDVEARCSRVAAFLGAGMKLEQEPYGSSFLHSCIQNLEALKALVAHGARINVTVKHYWEEDYTELDSAACSLKDPARAETLAFLKSVGSVHSKVDDSCNVGGH